MWYRAMIGNMLLVFGLAIITEGFCTSYAYFVARGDIIRGPLASGGIAILKAILVIYYVHEPWLIAALAVGQVVGTYITLKIIAKQKSSPVA